MKTNDNININLDQDFHGVETYILMNNLKTVFGDFNSSSFKSFELLVENKKDFDVFDHLKEYFPGDNFVTTSHNTVFQVDSFVNKRYIISYVLSLGRKYNTINVKVFSTSKENRNDIIQKIKETFTNYIIDCESFLLNWYFHTTQYLESVQIKELFSDVLIDSAYPSIPNLEQYVNNYLDSDESVLILLGPPGTGKSKLVRYILAQMTKRYGYTAKIMYTGDKRALESEQLFVEFCSSGVDGLVIEDIDYLLEPRSDGNKNMDAFLRSADGIIKAQQRKMIFTTNISSMENVEGKIDEALLRPGRCYDLLHLGRLNRDQATKFLMDLTGKEDSSYLNEVLYTTLNKSKKNDSFSLAELYQTINKSK